jgi:branched-chain amino acid transport system substrate-binding protein
MVASRLSKRLATLVLALTVSLACGGAATSSNSGGEQAATGEPYQVGYMGGLTYSVPSYPVNALTGIQSYFDNLNKHGGINGHPVNLTVRDDAGQPAKALTNFIELRDSIKVSAVTGNTLSNTTNVVIPLADQAQIPMTITSPTADNLTHPYVYGMDALFNQQAVAEVAAAKAMTKAGVTPRVAVYNSNSPSGLLLGNTVEAQVKSNGWNFLYHDVLAVPGPDDWTPIASKIVSNKADFVIGSFYGTQPRQLMLALQQQSWQGKVFSYSAGGDDPGLLIQLAQPNYYALRTYKYPTDSAAGPKALKAAASAIGKGDVSDEYASMGWATAYIVAQGLKACGFPCAGPALKAQLDKLANVGTVDGIAEGDLGFANNYHLAVHQATFVHFQDGKLVASAPVSLGNPTS